MTRYVHEIANKNATKSAAQMDSNFERTTKMERTHGTHTEKKKSHQAESNENSHAIVSIVTCWRLGTANATSMGQSGNSLT